MMTKDPALTHQEQIQRLMQIGAYLRQVREERNLSLEEVAASTMIQPRLLRAIESGEMHRLPEPVYIQGFIKRYADSLGLDGIEFSDAFPAEKVMRVPHQQPTWTSSPAAQLRPLHLYVAYIALIMASVSLLSYIVGRSSSTAGSLAETESGAAQTTQTTPRAAANAAPNTAPKTGPNTASGAASSRAAVGLSAVSASPSPSPKSAKPVQVAMKLTAQSWIEVEVDGSVALAEVLPEGTERNWTASNELRVRSGNAGGVMLAYNGGKAEPMGVPGAVEEKVFSPGTSPGTSSGASAASADSSGPGAARTEN